ncbi:MAG TPA: antitoxin family protein [Chloroflexia bacterium]|nr:antitoxin family protein [Chloroflexia bacterium]
MANVIEATFDGKVLCPDEPLKLEPNTRVRLVIEEVLPAADKTSSFLDTALSLKLDGPPDWSVNIDRYLYGDLQGDTADEAE